MNQIKIALTGQMRSGKDTVANYLEEAYKFHRFAFGDDLKLYAHQIFRDVPWEPKPRSLYQFMNVMREYDEDVWIKHVAEKVRFLDEMSNKPQSMVITDVRQQNEYDWCKKNGFIIVRVVSRLQNRIERMEEQGEKVEEKLLQHATENTVEALGEDFLLVNNGSLKDLMKRIDVMINEIEGGKVG